MYWERREDSSVGMSAGYKTARCSKFHNEDVSLYRFVIKINCKKEEENDESAHTSGVDVLATWNKFGLSTDCSSRKRLVSSNGFIVMLLTFSSFVIV
jgi:hypothetical protein